MAHQLPHVSLQKEDWYFSRCPKDEIFDCWVYEFAREYFLRRKTVPEACHMFFPVSDALKAACRPVQKRQATPPWSLTPS